MRLNPGQQQAVEFVTGPCLVLAGAGSGKTRVITNKIAHLIRGCGYQARHIAAVTFTNKAAREMKERVGQTLGRKEARGLMISTFHTLGLDIIKREYAALGMKANFSLFDDTDQLALLKELTEGLIEDDKVLLQQLISTISNWKNDLKTPSQAAASAIGERDRIFAHCYGLYDAHLKACNVLDFDDLILLPTLLLQRNEEVRERWQNKIRYLLVDEYQDTNTSQYELVKLLVGSRARFTVVGDDDQSIYSWRGARPQNLVLLSQDFPALKVIKLEQNYRSSGRILKAANILIANNPHVFEKRLFSELGYGTELKVLSANNEEHEAERVTGELIAHHFVNKTQYKDYAILYRGNHQSRVFEKFLMQNRIPYKISGGTSFFSRPEIKDLLAYLRVLTNPDDDSAFLRIVNTPKREIGPATLKKLGEYYAKAIHDKYGDDFDVLFGPAYKGIPLGVVTAIAYSELYGKEVRYCSDRKEEKDHGADKGSFLGSKLKDGDRVVMIEDVTTSGKSMEETVPKVKGAADVEIVGLMVSLNRMEVGKGGEKCALDEVKELYGFDTAAIVTMEEVVEHLYNRPYKGKVIIDDTLKAAIDAYYEMYGAK